MLSLNIILEIVIEQQKKKKQITTIFCSSHPPNLKNPDTYFN